VTFSDYRDVEGMRFPYRRELVSGLLEVVRNTTQIQSVQVVALEQSNFEAPRE
jgi:hypothetical protein